MSDDLQFNFCKPIRTLLSMIVWGIGVMVIGGFLNGLVGASIALSIMCYWRLCVMTTASPLFVELKKTMENFEKRQTINQALIADLEEMRAKFNSLREEFESFQYDSRK